MAKDPVSIPRDLDLPESKDYHFLRKQGFEYSQELSGEIWTDYNDHDPGVTILEQICLAMTELAYKSGMNIEDILYAKRDQPFDSEDNAFFTPELVFPGSPLTVIDYRRILIDQLYPMVKNAWLEPLESGAFGVNMAGLYKVSLIFDESAFYDLEDAKDKVYSTLNNYRNLGEDFEAIRALLPLPLSIRGHLMVNPAFLVENVLARVLFELSNFVTPPVGFQSRKELEELGMGIEDIFDGPMPKHGFVNLESLKTSGLIPHWEIPSTAELLSLIRDIEGVDGISDIDVGVYVEDFSLPQGFNLVEKFKGEEEHDGFYLTVSLEKLPRGHRVKDIQRPRRDLPEDFYLLGDTEQVPDGFYPQLDTPSILNQRFLRCTVEGLEYDYQVENVSKTLERLHAELMTQYQHPIVYPQHRPRSNRTAKELTSYYSVQNHFPEVYGIGRFGVSKNRPVEWRYYARNLKSYLFFYEQIMAGYLTQLVEFWRLFSLKEDIPQTYFHQVPDMPNRHLVLRDDQDPESLGEIIQKISNKFDPVGDRRNRSLDHLLARFGEEFLSDSYSALTRNTVEETQVKFEEEMIKGKIKFLRNISELTKDRGRGNNYLGFGGGSVPTDAVFHSNALSKRLALLFNMKDHMNMSLSESVRAAKGVSFNPAKTAKPKSTRGKAGFTFSASQQDILQTVLKDGLSRDNFAITEDADKKEQFLVFFGPTAGFGGGSDPVFQSNSYEKCEAAVTALIRRVRELNSESEGFHMIEHVLLRAVGKIMNTFYLVQEGRIYLETPVTEDETYGVDFKVQLLKRGFDSDSYVITGNLEEGYTLVLTEDDGSIVAFKEGYIDEMSAERERDKIILLLPQLEDNDPGIEIREEQYIPKAALLSDDFYSLQLSCILPAWPIRFRNEKFRALFEQVLKLNVPAHTITNTFWIDLAEMSDFEKIYNEWRNEKSKLHPKQPWLDELSWAMVIMLKYFANPNDDLVSKEMPMLRDKHGLSMKFAHNGE